MQELVQWDYDGGGYKIDDEYGFLVKGWNYEVVDEVCVDEVEEEYYFIEEKEVVVVF